MNTKNTMGHGFHASRARWAAAAGMGFIAGAMVVSMSPSFAADNGSTPSPTSSQTQLQDKGSSSSTPAPKSSSSSDNGNSGTTDNGNSGSTDNGGSSSGLAASNGSINPGMTLKSAQVTRQNLNDTNQEYVTFTFSRPVIKVASQDGFVLEGYSAKSHIASKDAMIIHGHPDQVLAGYPAGTDVRGFTAATVAPGAVTDESGRAALPDTAALGGSDGTSQAVDLPMLTSVTTDDTLNQVTFHFDQNLSKSDGTAKAADLGFYTRSGRAIAGQSIVTSDLHDVTVQFQRQVRDAAQFYANAGAVTSARGQQNPPTSTKGNTVVPNLTSVNRVGNTQVRYTFSQPISSVTAADFTVYTADGTAIPGKGFVKPSDNSIQVAFPQIQRYGGMITMASVSGGAVKATDSSQAPNTVGSMMLKAGSNATSGVTSGPDLTSAKVSSSTGQVLFTFNKAVNDSVNYKASDFQLITGAGDVTLATAVVGVDGDSVLVDFDPTDARSAHSAAVSSGAVQTFQGDMSPLSTVTTK